MKTLSLRANARFNWTPERSGIITTVRLANGFSPFRDFGWTDDARQFEFRFGAYGWTVVRVWERDEESASEVAFEWLEEHAPGLFTDPDYEAVAKGLGVDFENGSEDEKERVRTAAETDLTATPSGRFLASWEWTYSEISR